MAESLVECDDSDRFDDSIYKLYQQCPNGIHEMIDAIFSFLIRKTTFFTCYTGQEAEDFFLEKVRKYGNLHKLASFEAERLDLPNFHGYLEANDHSSEDDIPPVAGDEVTIPMCPEQSSGDATKEIAHRLRLPSGKRLVTKVCNIDGDIVTHNVIVDDDDGESHQLISNETPCGPDTTISSSSAIAPVKTEDQGESINRADSGSPVVVNRGTKRKIVMTMKAAESRKDLNNKKERHETMKRRGKRSWKVILSQAGSQHKKDVKKLSTRRPHVRKQYSIESMVLAYNAVTQLNTPLREAARMYNVPQTTLNERVNGKRVVNDDGKIHSGNSLFEKEEENTLVQHVTFMKAIGYPGHAIAIRRLAMEFAVDLGHRSVCDLTLSEKWLRNFRRRHPAIGNSRPATLTSHEIAECIGVYFTRLSVVYERYNLFDKPRRLFCIATHVFGERQHEKRHDIDPFVSEADHDDSDTEHVVTIVVTVSACGTTLPPFFVFPGNICGDILVNINAITNVNGKLDSNTFTTYYHNVFLPHLQSDRELTTPGDAVVLYDASSCHIPLSVIHKAADNNNGIHFISAPFHTSNLLPLNKGCIHKFDACFRRSCKSFCKSKRHDLTKAHISQMAHDALNDTLTPQYIRDAFQKAGAFPLNPSISIHNKKLPLK